MIKTDEASRVAVDTACTACYCNAARAEEADNTKEDKTSSADIRTGGQRTRDWVDITYTYTSQTVYVSENYNNIKRITGLNKSIFGDRFGRDMYEDIGEYLKEYHKGAVSKKDVEDYFYQCCTAMLNYRIDMHQTNGKNEADKAKILGSMYEVFAKQNMVAARYENYQEGMNVHAENGGNVEIHDWSYYNSWYYYQCEELKAMLGDITENMALKWDIEAIDTEKVLKESKYTIDGGFDFNSGWNAQFMYSIGVGYIENVGVTPPKAMRLYYFKSSVITKIVEITSYSEGKDKPAYSIHCTINEGIETTALECKQFMENMWFYGGYEEYEVSVDITRHGLYGTERTYYSGSMVHISKNRDWFKCI